MTQITLAIALISLLASCGTSKSGKIESNYSIVRVKMVNDSSTIDWVRLNTIESKVYRVGDTVRMNLNIHTVVTSGTDEATGSSMVVLDSLVGK